MTKETDIEIDGPIRVLWLTPNKPKNISVGRECIISYLEDSTIVVEQRAGKLDVLLDIANGNLEFDVVIGTTRAGAIIGMIVSVVTGNQLIVDHVDPIRQFEQTTGRPVAELVRRLENLTFHRSAHTLYVYPEERDRVTRHASTFTKTDLGVAYNRFANPDPLVIDRARNRLSEFNLHENVLIYVGGLEPIYHIDELIASLEHLPDWTLIVLGSGSLENVVTEAANSEAVVYLRTVPHEEVPGYLHLADVGVCLVDDPYTLKILEYGATRLPTVQLAGRAEEKFAGLVEFCDAEPISIATAVERARATDAATLDGLQNLAAKYSWERIASDYSRVIRSVGSS